MPIFLLIQFILNRNYQNKECNQFFTSLKPKRSPCINCSFKFGVIINSEILKRIFSAFSTCILIAMCGNDLIMITFRPGKRGYCPIKIFLDFNDTRILVVWALSANYRLQRWDVMRNIFKSQLDTVYGFYYLL